MFAAYYNKNMSNQHRSRQVKELQYGSSLTQVNELIQTVILCYQIGATKNHQIFVTFAQSHYIEVAIY